jgi:hypothetical protein
MALDAKYLRCEETETKEHLLHRCENYSIKIWDLAGRSSTMTISRHSGDYKPATDLTLLEIVYNKPHLSLLLLIKDGTTQMLILFLHEVKRDIIFRRV